MYQQFCTTICKISILFIPVFIFGSCDYIYQTKYVEVPLDHFNFNDNRTFMLRFLMNDSYWKSKNGPIFFYTGNEGKIEMFAQNTGFMWEIAKKFRALVVFAEHRYYGESLPFGNLSLSALKYFGYLSSQQALADFVDVIYYIKSRKWRHEIVDSKMHTNYSNCEINKHKRRNPVIAFGGSYGGMLAAWFRMKYPAVVQGALASSAPIWQFTGMTPCNAFNDVLTSAYNSVGVTECVGTIKKSWKIITDFAKTASGKDWIKQYWKLCTPLKSDDDVSELKGWLTNIYTDVAMTNYPYETDFLMPLPANPVKVLCSFLTNSSLPVEDFLMSVLQGISIYFNGTGTAKCLNWHGDPSADLGDAGWNIQACTEMVMPICASGKQDMFEPSPWNFKEFSDNCYKQYNVHPIEDMVEKEYGGKRINDVSNIIFSNGLLDPWSSGGVLYNISSSAIAVIIPESAHHLDLRVSNPKDPISVKNARNFYKVLFKKWIKKYYKKRYN